MKPPKPCLQDDPGADAPVFPLFAYSIASPWGDLAAEEADLRTRLEGCPSGAAYGDYFRAIQEVLATDGFRMLQSVAQRHGRAALPDRIHVRAEKHGALYHPASLELTWADGPSARYALLVAATERGRQALRSESQALDRLHRSFSQACVPRKLVFVEQDGWAFLLAPWFCGFHEFHVNAEAGFTLWDHDQGLRPLPVSLARQAYFQAARILTRYVDAEQGACIHPWSHAAGDFIVRTDRQDVDVRLSTVRDYQPLIETDHPLPALFAFVLDLALRMRLDRVEGVGEWVWLDFDFLESAMRGFFTAVRERGRDAGPLTVLARTLPSFTGQELLDGHEPILEPFSAGELAVILPRLELHCRELAETLQQADDA